MRKLLAPDMLRHSADVSYCIFSRPGYERPTLVVTAVPTLGDAATFAREARDTCEGDLTDLASLLGLVPYVEVPTGLEIPE